MQRIAIAVVIVSTLALGACSDTSTRTSPFKSLEPGELGCEAVCTLRAGTTTSQLLGPIVRNERDEYTNVDPYLQARLYMPGLDAEVSIDAGERGSTAGFAFADVENGEPVLQLLGGDAGGPAATVYCWRGEEVAGCPLGVIHCVVNQ